MDKEERLLRAFYCVRVLISDPFLITFKTSLLIGNMGASKHKWLYVFWILTENGFKRYAYTSRNLAPRFTPKNYVTTFKTIVRTFSGLK